MKLKVLGIALALAAGMAHVPSAVAADPDVVIGDIDDMSGIYADVAGAGAVEAIKMAIADFGGTVLGQQDRHPGRRPSEQARHRSIQVPRMGGPERPERHAGRLQYRRHDRDVQGCRRQEGAVLRPRRRRRLPDQRGLHGLHGALHLRHHRARQRHRHHDREERRQVLVLPDRRLRLRHAAADRRLQGRRAQRRQECRRGARAARPPRTSPPSCCRRRARVRRCWDLPMPARTSATP